MFISFREVETLVGPELAARMCEWVRSVTPVTCLVEQEQSNSAWFDIDEAIEFSKIKMHHDAAKREFFPHFVKLKQALVRASAQKGA